MNFLTQLFKKQPKSSEELWPELRAAIRDSNTQKIRKIIASHPSILNWRDEKGMTALHWAAQYQGLSSAACLIDLGSDPHLKDDLGYTPQQTAYWYGEFRMGAYTDICHKIVARIKEAEQVRPANAATRHG